ncbi:MAG: hypothetical protein QNL39_05815 [Akkermansiaceae bacterium]
MKNQFNIILSVGISSLGIALSEAQIPSFDDFMAPAANDIKKGIVAPTKVAKPDAVEITQESVSSSESKTPVVQADSAQDAVITAEQHLKEQGSDTAVMKVGSGLAYMAVGTATYREYKNREASLVDKRDAYVQAYIKAKANLAKLLYGLTNESQQALKTQLDLRIAGDKEKTLVNRDVVQTESIEQKVEGMLRGFVIYSVEDNVKKSEVRVVIVSSPKTMGQTMRAGGGMLLAANVRDGMKEVFKELAQGIVPPVGGRVITVPIGETEQLYFVAFGSSIIINHDDAEIARELRMDSFEEADMRAAANMCGLIIGDQISWNRGMNQSSRKEYQDFEKFTEMDPTEKPMGIGVRKLDNARKAYVKVKSKTSSFVSAQKGKLPAGLTSQKWESEDGDWAFVAYVYNPYTTAEAEKARESMLGSSILDRGNEITRDAKREMDRARGAGGEVKPRKKGPVGQGPSGKIPKNDDL